WDHPEMRTASRYGHYDGGIAVVHRALPTTFGRIVPALDNQPGLLLSPSGIRSFLLTRIASSLSGSFCSVSLLIESLVVCLSCLYSQSSAFNAADFFCVIHKCP